MGIREEMMSGRLYDATRASSPPATPAVSSGELPRKTGTGISGNAPCLWRNLIAYLDPIRDIFLFCCFSGLRHSDYKAIKPYIDIVDSIKASSLTKFDGLI